MVVIDPRKEYSRKEIQKKALKGVEFEETRYNALFNNCEHFANTVTRGKSIS